MCKYEKQYYDYEANRRLLFKCEERVVKDGFCIFHHPEYWKEHSEEVATEFYKKVESAIKRNEKLLCIGYNLPNITLKNKETPILSYFAGSMFHAYSDFYKVTFAEADFSEAKFKGNADFSGAKFKTRADFSRAKFKGKALFLETTFKKEAHLIGVEFADACFSNATFAGACFSNATFAKKADFRYATFARATFAEADFSEAKFKGNADFSGAKFKTRADFTGAKFKGKADFSFAEFKNGASLTGVEFVDADFTGAKFAEMVFFGLAKFAEKAEFRGVEFAEVFFSKTTFNSEANFSDARFALADFDEAKFAEMVFFRLTTFAHAYFRRLENAKANIQNTNDPVLVFENAIFDNPEEVHFDDFDLSNTSFVYTDVSRIGIGERVRWEANKKLMDERRADEGEVPYEVVATVYRRLRQNLESKLRYVEAGRFFIAEMEVKRKNVRTKNRMLKWLRANVFSTLAWYKYFSNYGESYNRIISWIIGTPLAFAFMTAFFTTPISNLSQYPTNFLNHWKDYVFAFLQLKTDNPIELTTRILSLLFMGQLYIALKRQFERRYKATPS